VGITQLCFTLDNFRFNCLSIDSNDIWIIIIIKDITLNSRGANGSVPVSMMYTLDDESDGRTSLLRDLLESPKQLENKKIVSHGPEHRTACTDN